MQNYFDVIIELVFILRMVNHHRILDGSLLRIFFWSWNGLWYLEICFWNKGFHNNICPCVDLQLWYVLFIFDCNSRWQKSHSIIEILYSIWKLREKLIRMFKVRMDFVRSYRGTNEPLTSWTLLSSLFFPDQHWSDLFIKNRTRTVLKLLLLRFNFLWISL